MASTTTPKNKQKALFAALAGSGMDDLNVMFLSFALSSIITDLGITGAQGGFISTITNLGMLLGGLVFGVLADRKGNLKLFKWSILIFSLATAAMFFADSFFWICVLRFIAGIGAGGEYGIAMSIIAKVSPPEKLGVMSSWNGVAGQLGSISAALLAGAMIPLLGWRALFLFGLIPVILVIWLHTSIDGEFELMASTEEITKEKPSLKELFKTKDLTRTTVSLMFMATVQIAGYFGLMNWLPSILQKQMGLSVTGSSLWMVVTIVGMCAGMLTFGRLLDKFGPRIIFALFLLVAAASVFMFVYANSQLTLLFGGAFVGFFVNGMFPGYGAVVSQLYPARIHSIANNAVLNVGRAIGGFSSLVIGFLMDNYSLLIVMGFLSVLYLTSFIVMMTIPGLKKDSYMTVRSKAIKA
ncbi:MFS transporter [Desemzia sp. RIT804]|uniref:MFS transporter n=1 Tax=Desemzia sp. RIT 804 TaxID=2810209 RepID=UPI00195292A8|nr:MFS transporter [Desemzia sp. RIT 804]MBM6614515.1 MFS transporter [Desemzia sp. RIT 804]